MLVCSFFFFFACFVGMDILGILLVSRARARARVCVCVCVCVVVVVVRVVLNVR